jgi:CubicO group peptidase (beta-lactamase class C family)
MRLALFPFLIAAVLPAATAGQQAADLRVDTVFAQFDRPDSPGCALGIYRDGGIAYARGYGMAVLEHGVPITPATIFDIGSTSKQFSAAAIALLAQDGALSLDDDVRRWVPELPEYGRVITIRHLLHHTSGLRDYINLLTLGGARIDDVTTAADALAAIVRQRELNFAPGDEHLYSNSGYFLLSVIVERASGRTLRDFARDRIFDPLGMTATHYLGSYDDVVAGRAAAYSPRAGGGWRSDVSRWLQTGDGAVFTSVEELLHWDSNFHEPRVGGAPLLEMLHGRGVLTSGDTLGYALGVQHGTLRGARTVSHGGSWGGFRAELLRLPEQRASVAVLCNAGNANPTQLARRVAELVLADALPEPPPPAAAQQPRQPPAAPQYVELDAAQLDAIAGAYHSPELEATYRIERDGARLLLHRRPNPPQPLNALGPDELTPGGAVRLRLERDAAGRATGFLLDVGRVRNLRFDRVD